MSARVIGPVLARAGGDALIGRRVAHYEVLDLVAHGGMGVVYRAHDPRLGRFAALKFLPVAISLDDGARARMLMEARSASALDHSNIGVVYDIGEHDGRQFIAFAWYDGDTLKSRLAEGPLPLDDVLPIGRQVAAALAAAHRAGIVHRDVKPSNIIITPDGTVKLLDFGIAKRPDSDLTGQGTTLGTVAYMSPEQSRCADIDARTDVWSFGVVLYEMLAGRRPFAGDNDAAVIFGIRSDEPDAIARLRPDTPPALADIVETCLVKDPAQRYADGEAMLAAFGSAASGEAPTAPPIRARGGTRRNSVVASVKRMRPGRRVVTVVGAISLLMAAMYAASAIGGGDRALEPQRVLVPPLENRSGDATLDPVGSIAADLIIGDITRAGLPDVVPVTAALAASRHVVSEQRSDTTARTRQLAIETGAGIVVTGAYYVERDSLYLHAQIMDMTAGDVIGAAGPVATHVDAPLAGIVALREQLLTELAPHLLQSGREITQWAHTPPPFEAYRAFALGLELFIERHWPAAIERFAEAAHVDSTFTPALLMAGLAHVNLGNLAAVDSILDRIGERPELTTDINRMAFDVLDALVRGDHDAGYRAHLRAPEFAPGTFAHWGLANSALWVNRPHESVRVARDLDPERGDLRGWFLYWRDFAQAYHRLGEHRKELRVARRARELFPGDAAALRLEARSLAALGSTRSLERLLAREMDEGIVTANLLLDAGLELRAHGEVQAGIALIRRSLEYAHTPSWNLTGRTRERATAHYYLGEYALAERLSREHLTEFPASFQAQALLGLIAARRGETAEAMAMADRLAALDYPYLRGANTWWRARIAVVLGRPDEAVRLLEQTYLEGLHLWQPLHVEPDFDPLRTYPPFVAFVRPRG
jgi:tetratricopeptide (TPR) repeat protein